MLVKKVEIAQLMPCIADPAKKLSDCTVLAEDKYRGAWDTLVSLLKSAGYEAEV